MTKLDHCCRKEQDYNKYITNIKRYIAEYVIVSLILRFFWTWKYSPGNDLDLSSDVIAAPAN